MGKTETWKGDQGKYAKISRQSRESGTPDQFHSYFEIFEIPIFHSSSWTEMRDRLNDTKTVTTKRGNS